MSRPVHSKLSPHLFQKLFELSNALKESSLDPITRDLVHIRASQLNHCAFCTDMHVKEAKIHGERELRLHHIAIWRESPLFSAKEKAVFEWTEALTLLKGEEEAYEKVREHLTDKELVDLTYDISVINVWNRLNALSQTVPGSMDKMFGLDKAYF